MRELSPVAKAAALASVDDTLKRMLERAAEKDRSLDKVAVGIAFEELKALLAADLENALAEAIEKHLAIELTDPAVQLADHRLVAEFGEDGQETYLLDGVALLWAGPVTVARNGDEMAAHRTLKHLK